MNYSYPHRIALGCITLIFFSNLAYTIPRKDTKTTIDGLKYRLANKPRGQASNITSATLLHNTEPPGCDNGVQINESPATQNIITTDVVFRPARNKNEATCIGPYYESAFLSDKFAQSPAAPLFWYPRGC